MQERKDSQIGGSALPQRCLPLLRRCLTLLARLGPALDDVRRQPRACVRELQSRFALHPEPAEPEGSSLAPLLTLEHCRKRTRRGQSLLWGLLPADLVAGCPSELALFLPTCSTAVLQCVASGPLKKVIRGDGRVKTVVPAACPGQLYTRQQQRDSAAPPRTARGGSVLTQGNRCYSTTNHDEPTPVHILPTRVPPPGPLTPPPFPCPPLVTESASVCAIGCAPASPPGCAGTTEAWRSRRPPKPHAPAPATDAARRFA